MKLVEAMKRKAKLVKTIAAIETKLFQSFSYKEKVRSDGHVITEEVYSKEEYAKLEQELLEKRNDLIRLKTAINKANSKNIPGKPPIQEMIILRGELKSLLSHYEKIRGQIDKDDSWRYSSESSNSRNLFMSDAKTLDEIIDKKRDEIDNIDISLSESNALIDVDL